MADVPGYMAQQWADGAYEDNSESAPKKKKRSRGGKVEDEELWDTMSQNPNPDGRPRKSSAGQRRKKERKLLGGTIFGADKKKKG